MKPYNNIILRSYLTVPVKFCIFPAFLLILLAQLPFYFEMESVTLPYVFFSVQLYFLFALVLNKVRYQFDKKNLIVSVTPFPLFRKKIIPLSEISYITVNEVSHEFKRNQPSYNAILKLRSNKELTLQCFKLEEDALLFANGLCTNHGLRKMINSIEFEDIPPLSAKDCPNFTPQEIELIKVKAKDSIQKSLRFMEDYNYDLTKGPIFTINQNGVSTRAIYSNFSMNREFELDVFIGKIQSMEITIHNTEDKNLNFDLEDYLLSATKIAPEGFFYQKKPVEFTQFISEGCQFLKEIISKDMYLQSILSGSTWKDDF